MSKRKYVHYEEDVVNHKHGRNKHRSDSHKKNNGMSRLEFSDSSNGRDSVEISVRNGNKLHTGGRDVGKNKSGESSSRKLAKLLDALDDVLLLDSEDVPESSTAFDEETISQCKALRKVLRRKRNLNSTGPTLITIAAPESGRDRNERMDEDLLYVLDALSLTPWTSASISSALPALPTIKSPALETATFTHSGVTSNAGTLSYERLEWVGDAYLYLISTLLISSTFTGHLPGKCTQIRELLVKNETLAFYARRYGFDKRARLPAEFSIDSQKGCRAKEGEKIKVMGDIFEAYIAAVVLSDPEHGVNRVSSWLKSLWAQTISKQIHDQELLNKKAKAASAGDVNAVLNPKDLLSRTIGAKGVKITYKDAGSETKDPLTGFPLFTVVVYLDGWGEHEKPLGKGQALGKKDAGMKAAEMALANKELMTLYGEMKRVYDEKRRYEKERVPSETGGISQTITKGKSPDVS